MDIDNLVSLPTLEKDEIRIDLEKRVRRLELIAEHADRLGVVQFAMYQGYKKAGFDDYDARVMALEYRPHFQY